MPTLHETVNEHTTWVIRTHTAWKARTHFFFQLFFEKGQFFLENCPRVSVTSVFFRFFFEWRNLDMFFLDILQL